MCQGICNTPASTCEVRFLGATKPTAETAKVASVFSLVTSNASALGPMIPAMVTRILTVAFVSVVLIGLGVFVAYYAFELAFHFPLTTTSASKESSPKGQFWMLTADHRSQRGRQPSSTLVAGTHGHVRLRCVGASTRRFE